MRHGIKAIVLLVLFFALRAPIEVVASGSVQSNAQYFLSLVNYRGYPRGEDGGNSLIAFFNVCKYPPSPAYQLITLGTVSAILFLFAAFPFGLALVASTRASAAAAASASLIPSHGAASDSADDAAALTCGQVFAARLRLFVLTFGRTPLFFYALHFCTFGFVGFLVYLCRPGLPLAFVPPVWAVLVAFPLRWACERYDAFKSATAPESLWRLL